MFESSYLTFWLLFAQFFPFTLILIFFLDNDIYFFILQHDSFRSALSELDLLENSIPQHPSCDNTPIFGEKNSKIIFGVFEAFSSSRRDFSQINLFSDIVTPLTIHGEIEFNHDRESSDKNLSVDAYHLYDMYSCIMRQITEKRKRLQYLLKRFG